MNYHNIVHDDLLNGEGLRVTLFVSGCNHHCKGCQNPETWDKNSGIEFDENAFNEIITELEKDYVSGITFSGGDPLHLDNLGEISYLCSLIKSNYPGKTIWLYTGYTYEYLLSVRDMSIGHGQIECVDCIDLLIDDILNCIDVLVDGEFKERLKNNDLKWRGSSNQRVIDVPKSLKSDTVVLYCD